MLYNGWILLIVFDVHDVMKSQKIRWNHVLRAPARPLQKRHRRFALYGNPTWPRGDQILQKVNLALLIASTKFTKVKAFPDWDPESPQPHQRFRRQCFRNVAGRFLREAWPEIRRAPAVLDQNLWSHSASCVDPKSTTKRKSNLKKNHLIWIIWQSWVMSES